MDSSSRIGKFRFGRHLFACVRKFQTRDGAMITSSMIWRGLPPRDRLRTRGKDIDHARGRLDVAFGRADPYLSPIDFRPDDLDLLWKRSR